jgi:two-component system sensor histidine kinase HydH
MKMKMKNKNISFSIILFIFSVLGLILAITTYRDIQREKEYLYETIKNKGITLAFSLQASARINLTRLDVGNEFLQELIEKASKDPDIAYIAVVDDKSIALAHTNKQVVGKPLPFELGSAKYVEKNKINTRMITSSISGGRIIEVIEPFIFIPPPIYSPDDSSLPSLESEATDPGYNVVIPSPDVYWWVIGFKLEKAIFATRTSLFKAIAMGVLLLILGSMALYTIFTLQKYYLTKETLVNTSQSIGKILSSMSNGVVFINNTGQILSFNSAAEKITGYTEEEIRGRPYKDIFSDEELRDSPLLLALNTGKSCHDIDSNRVVKDGRRVPLKVSAFPIHDENGNIIGAGEIFQDLQMIRELEERVRRADRLASLGKLAAGIAHEVRNPLASIKGFAQYLKGTFSHNESGAEYADIIVEEVERLDKVVSALLNFAKPKPLQLEMHSINSIIEEALTLIEDKAKADHISIIKNFVVDIPLTAVDKEQIKQVFLNIFLNATQEMEEGGTLEVTSRSGGDSSVMVEIKDTGRGISTENMKNIFSPFFTTKESGFGLGLSIAHTIIESHGGEISVKSEIEKGTIFKIQIPVDYRKMNVRG